uniref:Uncharacterized protein n=1 Tax=Oryza sativa subsp. japonica TaxID=39947 RepID=Q6Z361_ORYSJ|nr:hypothetical protein [Oryza sativa Japonica Group]BAD31129.1 hypothetical protein [Oryza sativa Japonica Group]
MATGNSPSEDTQPDPPPRRRISPIPVPVKCNGAKLFTITASVRVIYPRGASIPALRFSACATDADAASAAGTTGAGAWPGMAPSPPGAWEEKTGMDLCGDGSEARPPRRTGTGDGAPYPPPLDPMEALFPPFNPP